MSQIVSWTNPSTSEEESLTCLELCVKILSILDNSNVADLPSLAERMGLSEAEIVKIKSNISSIQGVLSSHALNLIDLEDRVEALEEGASKEGAPRQVATYVMNINPDSAVAVSLAGLYPSTTLESDLAIDVTLANTNNEDDNINAVVSSTYDSDTQALTIGVSGNANAMTLLVKVLIINETI